jgi:CHAT domain-containing protein
VTLQICLNTAGLNYLERGDYKKAGSYLARALDLSKRMDDKKRKSEVLQNLALAAIGTKSWDDADDHSQRALELERDLKDSAAEQMTLVSKAQVLAGRGNFAGALSALAEVSRLPSATASPRINAEQQYIAIYRKLHDEGRARAHYRSAAALADTVRAGMQKDENKLAWYESQISLTQEWVRFLIEAHRTDEALEVVEASRARLMTERIDRASSAQAGTVADYQRFARGSTLVSYWLMPEVSYVWIVKPGSVEIRTLPGEDAIASLVGSYQSFLEGRRDPLDSDNRSGEELRKAVLDPVRPLLAGAKNVILVPDGPLNALNFETLPVDGHYWIDDVTLTVTPSLNILTAANATRVKAARTALVVGDARPTLEFPQLPDAGREIETVARLFPQSTVLRGAQATPAAYRNAPDSAAYIHFAAHASASAERPLDSAVILSGDGNSEGRLTAQDLLAKPIHAELVTISACRSAGVRSYHGEGLVGFAWVFLQTGAHGVIAGLWDASDNATADIMSGLYTGIAHGETPPAALRAAKLKLVHGQSHLSQPFYWAPFQYYQGSGR